MATKRKRRSYGLRADPRGIWHCDFSVAGQRIQRSTYTADRKAAEEFCAAIAARVWREEKLGEAPSLTWAQACDLWLRKKSADGNRDVPNGQDKIRVLADTIPADTLITRLDARALDLGLDALGKARGWTNTTRNRHRSFILGVLNLAEQSGYAAPRLRLTRMVEPKIRVRWLTKDEARRLIGELPLHLARMVRFSLATGLRQSNVTGLCWQNVDLGRRLMWVNADESKSGRTISVPLSGEAVAVLLEAKACDKHSHARLVFTYYGAAIENPNNSAWLKALARAGIKAFRWHDLRHTWASWHVMGLMSADGTPTPLPVLQKLGGWNTPTMLQRYAHLAPDYVAQWAGDAGLVATEQPALRVAA